MKTFLKWLLILVLLGAAVYSSLVLMVVWKEKHVPPMEDYDAIIILGAQVKPEGVPSLQLQWRLDAGLEAWQKKPCPIVVCGAQGSDEPAPEAFVMRDYLTARGVPAESIYTDPDSFNTRQNIDNAVALLKGQPVQKVLIVTSDYHLPRAIALAGDAGLTASGLPSPTLGGWHWVKNHGREALAWCKYWAQKYLGL